MKRRRRMRKLEKGLDTSDEETEYSKRRDQKAATNDGDCSAANTNISVQSTYGAFISL